jgi:hypothetical protein
MLDETRRLACSREDVDRACRSAVIHERLGRSIKIFSSVMDDLVGTSERTWTDFLGGGDGQKIRRYRTAALFYEWDLIERAGEAALRAENACLIHRGIQESMKDRQQRLQQIWMYIQRLRRDVHELVNGMRADPKVGAILEFVALRSWHNLAKGKSVVGEIQALRYLSVIGGEDRAPLQDVAHAQEQMWYVWYHAARRRWYLDNPLVRGRGGADAGSQEAEHTWDRTVIQSLWTLYYRGVERGIIDAQ